MTVQEAFGEFVAEYEYRGCTERTIGFYQEHVRHFLKDTGVTQLEEFNEAKIRAWLVSHRKLSPNTLQTYDKALRVVARWFHTRGFVTEFPMAKLPKPKGRNRTIVVFSAADIRAMLEDATKRREGSRDKALILLLLDTGIRIGEAHTLALHNVNWAENFITVSGKTGERIVPFGPRSKRAMRSYIDVARRAANTSIKQVFLTHSGLPLDISTLTKRVRLLARAAKVKATKCGPHTFRHTFAVEFIRAGGDVFSLQQILGHTTLEMTRHYVHFAKSDLREAHRKFSPVSRML